MLNNPHENSTIKLLAKRLEQDIYRRGLRAGDRYLTAVEAAEFLGVSRATADRAMSALADTKTLLRRRSMGTFVGPGAKPRRNRMKTVYVIAPDNAQGILLSQGLGQLSPRADSLIRGVRHELPEVSVQFNFLPGNNDAAHIRELVSEADERGELVGVLAAGCPREIYQALADSGAPTIVLGSLYLDNTPLPSVDLDNREAARLLVRYLVERGHRRMALIIHADGRPGDHDFLDGINEVLAEAGLPAGTMTIRIVRREMKAIRSVVAELLTTENRPTAFVARGKPSADAIRQIAEEQGLTVPKEVEIVLQEFDASRTDSTAPIPYPHAQAVISDEQNARQIGVMLRKMLQGEPLGERHVVVPAEFVRIGPSARDEEKHVHWNKNRSQRRKHLTN